MGKKTIYWVRNDQRIHDNQILERVGQEDTEWLLPVYIYDPLQWQKLGLDFYKTGYFRTKFLQESLEALQAAYKQLGSNLYVAHGRPAEVLKDLAIQLGADQIYAQKEHTSEEIATEEEVEKQATIPVFFHEGLTLYHPEDLPFGPEKTPYVFTDFRKKVEKYGRIRDLAATPTSLPPYPNIDQGAIPQMWELGLDYETYDKERAALHYFGGEQHGLDRLQYYFWDSDLIQQYKKTRNGLIGPDYSSKFSAWLANGNLSPRKVYWEVKKYEEEVHKNDGTYWLIFELIWRDFFRYVAMKHGKKIFHLNGIQKDLPKYRNRLEDFMNWMLGTTGQDFVDANMCELLTTGYMSNRGRQVTASYLCKDLQVDWRWGAAWFENRLVDYDPASNWGNWMYVAGVGNDPRKDRYFNPVTQAEKYDKDGRYRSIWIQKPLEF